MCSSGSLLSYETRIILANALPAPLIKHSIPDEIKAGWNYTTGANGEKGKINVWPLDLLSLSLSVEDLFDAPAAEEEIEALLNRLDETVGKVSTQEVLASSQTHGYVPKVLSQRGGGHGLGERTLGMHGSREENKQKQQGGQSMRRNRRWGLTNRIRLGPCKSWGLLRIPGTVSSSTYNLLYKLQDHSIHVLLFLDCSLLSNIRWLIKGLVYLCCALFPSVVQTLPQAPISPESAPYCYSLICSQTGEFQ